VNVELHLSHLAEIYTIQVAAAAAQTMQETVVAAASAQTIQVAVVAAAQTMQEAAVAAAAAQTMQEAAAAQTIQVAAVAAAAAQTSTTFTQYLKLTQICLHCFIIFTKFFFRC
jgi:hypothetical protein